MNTLNINQITQFLADLMDLGTSSGESYGNLYTIDQFNGENSFNEDSYKDLIEHFGVSQFTIDGHTVSVLDGQGGEGHGDDYWRVAQVGNLGFIQASGYYSSWDGFTITNVDVVYPRDIVKTIWSLAP